MKRIDLRSDTVTHPTQAMRDAMYKAELGDDVFGDDPTVIRLEEKAAARLGKEAALFVPSGSMGNLVSILTHCQRGDEIILGDRSHIFSYEQGSTAAVGGVHARPLRNGTDGKLDLCDIEAAINDNDIHRAHTSLICLENTWSGSGSVLSPDYLDSVAAIAKKHQLKMHMDGARLFNAAVAIDVPVARLTRDFDSVQLCFSKGLSCPVGSIICADAEFIRKARRNRKLLGGAMRQVGVLAAACIVALDEMVDRLVDDHRNAKRLAAGLAEFSQLEINPDCVETNLVFFAVKTMPAAELAKRLHAAGVLVIPVGQNRIRAVTHAGISEADIGAAIETFKATLAQPVGSTAASTAPGASSRFRSQKIGDVTIIDSPDRLT